MRKQHLVKLTNEQRLELYQTIKKTQGSPRKIKRAQILLKTDIIGPNWVDTKIAKTFDCKY